MISVSIAINGELIYARAAVNRLRETGKYVVDDGSFIEHNPEDGAVELASVKIALEPTVTWYYKKSGQGGTMHPHEDDGVYLDPEGIVVFNVAHTGGA